MKVVIIGASHGGLQAAITLKRVNPNLEIVMIERRSEVSFVSSGLVIQMNRLVDTLDQVRYLTATDILEMGIELLLETNVIGINPEKKVVTCRKQHKQLQAVTYDKLILATGSNQISKNLEVSRSGKVMVFKDYQSSVAILNRLEEAEVVSIIGGGYIGVELCDALKDSDKEIHLIECADSLLFRYIDKEFSQVIEKEVQASGIHLHLNENVIGFKNIEKQRFISQTTHGEIENDYVLIAVNARPDSHLVQEFLEINANGTIKVNEYMQTSDEDIYAIGDVVSHPVRNSFRKSFIPLVNNVVRSATVAAMSILGHPLSYQGTQKTTATKVFGYYIASTGLTETEAIFEDFDVECIYWCGPYQMPYLEQQEDVHVKLVFDKQSRLLLGGQIMSKRDLVQSVDTLSLAIDKEVTLEELVTMDFFFNPAMNQPLGLFSRAAYELLIKQYKVTDESN